MFSAGVDTRAFAGYDRDGRIALARGITRMTAALLSVAEPVVVAVTGHAVGGGLVLALCADHRVATNAAESRFGLLEARAGVPFPAGPVEVIAAELPSALRRQMTLSSAFVPGERLLAASVFDELAEPEAVVERALTRAAELSTQPGFVAVKRQIRGPLLERLRARVESGVEPAFED